MKDLSNSCASPVMASNSDYQRVEKGATENAAINAIRDTTKYDGDVPY
jgi:hypothetical protein